MGDSLFESATELLTLDVLADRLTHVLRLRNPCSSIWPGCEVVTECLLQVIGLELPFERPETETDIDMDMDVEAEVEIDARLPALSQSRDFFPLHLPVYNAQTSLVYYR